MGYSAEVVQRARTRLAQAKEDRESENRQHLAEAYAKVPRIREIDMLLRRTMAQAAQAAYLRHIDGPYGAVFSRLAQAKAAQTDALLRFLARQDLQNCAGKSGYAGV